MAVVFFKVGECLFPQVIVSDLHSMKMLVFVPKVDCLTNHPCYLSKLLQGFKVKLIEITLRLSRAANLPFKQLTGKYERTCTAWDHTGSSFSEFPMARLYRISMQESPGNQ